MTAFPCRIPILHEVFDGGGEDAHGNIVESWAPPVEVLVFGWEPPKSTEPVLAGHDRVVVDIVLYGPRDRQVRPRDRIALGGGRFEVVGIPGDPNNNPWFQPGLVTIYLRRVDG